MEVACGGSDTKGARWCLSFRGGASRRLPVQCGGSCVSLYWDWTNFGFTDDSCADLHDLLGKLHQVESNYCLDVITYAEVRVDD